MLLQFAGTIGPGETVIEASSERTSAGFMKICNSLQPSDFGRTSLGFAGARDPARRISNPRALAQYQKISISLVRHCLLRRKGSGINGILLQQMEMAAQNAGGWRKQEERKRAAAAKK